MARATKQPLDDLIADNSSSNSSSSRSSSTSSIEAQQPHPYSLSFPTLTPDGSIEDLRIPRPDLLSDNPSYPTPPAALSSLASRTNMDLTESVSSMGESAYDMIDDISDHETVSITSTNDRSERESLVGGAYDDITGEEEHDAFELDPLHAMFDAADTKQEQLTTSLQTSSQSLDDELEDPTPRQSMMPQHVAIEQKQQAVPVKAQYVDRLTNLTGRMPWTAIMSAALTFLMALSFGMALNRADGFAQVHARRELLSQSFVGVPSSAINMEHLLPYPVLARTNFLGQKTYNWTNTFRHQALAPNHMIFAVPRYESIHGNYPQINSIHVHKGDEKLDFNQTMLIDGVYDITIDPALANGLVTVIPFAVRPMTDTVMRFDFGKAPSMADRGRTAHQKALTLRDTITRDIQIFVNSTATLLENVGTMAYDATKKNLEESVDVAKKTIEARAKIARKNYRFVQKSLEKEAAKRVKIARKNAKYLQKSLEREATKRLNIARKNACALQKKMFGENQKCKFQSKAGCSKCKR